MCESKHTPVLLHKILETLGPISGTWLDGTFGGGGYTSGLLQSGADHVIAIDRDPSTRINFDRLSKLYPNRVSFINGNYCDLDLFAMNHTTSKLAGVVLDVGLSSMQLDTDIRGFSFRNNGPLDMRMSQVGPAASDFINNASEKLIADVLYYYGEERSSRRIARAIVEERKKMSITSTEQLSKLIRTIKVKKKKSKTHPATQVFQAIRIAINNELENLFKGLLAAEKSLEDGGILAVVTFHSLEDRIVKRFLQIRSQQGYFLNSMSPDNQDFAPSFERLNKKPIQPDREEIEENVRSRSAKLRLARRLDGNVRNIEPAAVGLPLIQKELEKFRCE